MRSKFLETYGRGIRLGFVTLATILALGASGFKFHETYATNKRVDEQVDLCEEKVAGNSQQINSILRMQQQNALAEQHRIIQKQIFEVENYWRGKVMPPYEAQRLQNLRIQLRQLELQLGRG